MVLLTQMLYRLRIQVLSYGLGLALWVGFEVLLFPSVADSLSSIEYPQAILDAFGVSGTNLGDPRAFFGAEFFSLGPLALGAFVVAASTAALAGEESAGTMEPLAALPFSRRQMFVQKAVAVFVAAAGVTALGWAASVPFVDLGRELTIVELVGATFAQLSFAAFLGAVGMLFGAVAPSRGTAAACTGALLVIAYLLVAIASSVDAVDGLKYASPYYYSDLSGILVDGVDPRHQVVLWGGALAVGYLALIAFEGRELGAERWQFDAFLPRGDDDASDGGDMTSDTTTAVPRRTRRGMSAPLRAGIFAALVAILASGGLVAYRYTASLPPTLKVSGRVEAPTATILAPTSGLVVTLTAALGQTVAQGDLLGWMENTLDKSMVPITAPHSGRITTLSLDQGQFAAAGTPVVVIHELTEMHALLEVDESDIGRVATGQAAQLTFTSLGLTVEGRVGSVDTLPTRASGARSGQSRKYEVKVPLAGVDQRVIIGLPVDARIAIAPRS